MILGIDLGTTNSAAAIWRDGAAVLVPNALGDFLTPSAVAFDEEGRVAVGLAARDRQETAPAFARTLFKRAMGTAVKWKLGPGTSRKHGAREYGAEDLSALVLRSLKADAEAFAGEPVTGAIVTVPAYFNDKQRKATRRAGELAGLDVKRLINEPTAAALAYGIHELEEERPFLVFDLGGGTFDVSIVEIFDGVIEVRSSAGDNRLGGEDFNAVLMAMTRTALPALGEIDDERFDAALRGAAERCRRALSESDEAVLRVTWDGETHEVPVTGASFEEASAKLVARLREPVIRSLRDGGTRVEELSEIVLVGGATRMPIVRRAVTRMFGRFPATRVHPDHAVALGAAVQAGLLARDAGLKEIRLTDVCPFSLGVDTSERAAGGGIRSGLFMPIIERNTVVPASRVETFSTIMDGQRHVEFNIYQGEARQVAENVHLGKVTVAVPPKRAGMVSLDCRFSYDASGLLEVDIHVPETDTRKSLVIVGDEDEDAAALAKRRRALEGLKVHPREEAANAALLARAERCYEAQLGELRAYVGDLIGALTEAFDGQDPREIERMRGEVSAALDRLDGDAFL